MKLKEEILHTKVVDKFGVTYTIEDFTFNESIDDAKIILSNGKKYVLVVAFRCGSLRFEEEIAHLIREAIEEAAREKEAKEREARSLIPPKLTGAEVAALFKRAKAVFAERVAYYAPIVGVTYNKISLWIEFSSWGACHTRGDLRFNPLLLFAPPEALDAVVVHELCHRKHMDHSSLFYVEVLRVFPDYYKQEVWLREHARDIFSRMP